MNGLLVDGQRLALAKALAADVAPKVSLAAVPRALVTLLVGARGEGFRAVLTTERQLPRVTTHVHYTNTFRVNQTSVCKFTCTFNKHTPQQAQMLPIREN